MPLNVGDAVLTFLGDTTQLDQVFARLPDQADTAMSAAADSVSQVGDAAKDVSFELDATGSNAAYAGGEIEDAMVKAKTSTYEARGEIGLLGELFGIHLPRHVRSFVAELPGVGTALESAFAATAVFFLIEALVKGTEKLTDWISNTFIFTQAMKDSDEAVKEQNKTLLALADQIDRDSEALKRFGKTQGELKSDKVEELQAEIKKNEAALAAATKAANAYARSLEPTAIEQAATKLGQLPGILGTIGAAYGQVALYEKSFEESIEAFFTGDKSPAQLAAEAARIGQKAQADAAIAAQKKKDDDIQLDLARKDRLATQLQDETSAAKQSISIAEMIGNAKIKIWAADALYQAAFAKDAAEATLKVQQEEAEKEYQLKLQTLEKERAAEQRAAGGLRAVGDNASALKQIAQVKETNAKIEALNADHYAKLKQQAMNSDETILKLHADAAVLAINLAQGFFPNLPATTRNLLSMNDAAAKLGITLSTSLSKDAKDNQAAMHILEMEYRGGVISLHDYLAAQLAVQQQQLLLDKSLGNTAGIRATEKAIDELTKKLQKLEGDTVKTKGFWDSFATDFAKKSKNVGTEAQAMGNMLGQAAAHMDEAFASAMIGAIQSGKSIGAALEAATGQVLVNLATQAAAHAIYCTAMGIAELALGVTDSSAAEWFAAAAEFGLVAGVSGAAGIAMSGGSGGGGVGSTGPRGSGNPGSPNQAQSAGGGSQQTVGVTRLAGGGIVTSPTIFMAGDSPSGGSANEAILPLENSDAMERIANALLSSPTLRMASAGMTDPAAVSAAAHVGSGGFDEASLTRLAERIGSHLDSSGGAAGDTHLHAHVKGMISPDNLGKVMRKMSKRVQNRQSNLHASNALRVTRRSQ